MDYKNTETKLETLVTYFNEERINLNPVFQRGSVWNLKMRRTNQKYCSSPTYPGNIPLQGRGWVKIHFQYS
jgi:hypothetical protein